MELIIKGNDKRIKRLAKELKVRVKRDGSKLLLIESKKQDEKPKAKDVIALIEKVDALEGLKEFETDDRKTVKEAYSKKKAELTVED